MPVQNVYVAYVKLVWMFLWQNKVHEENVLDALQLEADLNLFSSTSDRIYTFGSVWKMGLGKEFFLFDIIERRT